MSELRLSDPVGTEKTEENESLGSNRCPMVKMISGLTEKLCDATVKLTRSEEKQLAIVEAAEKLFMANGFAVTSMDDIAKEAGVSKRTVYAHFTSKEILFTSVIEVFIAKVGVRGVFESDLSRLSPKDALVQTGVHFLNLILNPQALALFRRVVAEAPTFTTIGPAFYEVGCDYFLVRLSEVLKVYHARGELHVEDPDLTAEVIFSAMKGGPHFRAMILDEFPESPEVVERYVERVVETILNGLAPRT